MGKYFPLQDYLVTKRAEGYQKIKISLVEIIALVGELPDTAYNHPSAFWGNGAGSPTHVQKRAWLSSGWNVTAWDNLKRENETGSITFSIVSNASTFDYQIIPSKNMPSASNRIQPKSFRVLGLNEFSAVHLPKQEFGNVINDFIAKSNPEDRFTSFDYCYNYFRTTRNLTDDIEKSCLVLGFYLSSWGMLRGSSFLFQKSIAYFKPLIEFIATVDPEIWEIDVDTYTHENIQKILDIYLKVKDKLIVDNNRDLTLVTKILLGVFGFIPAFDRYFINTFKEIYGEEKCSFSKVDFKSLSCIRHFYEINRDEIDRLASSIYTTDFSTGKKTTVCYPKAKIIDMYGFTLGINV